MDKLRAINVFRRVIELGSFKAAAEDMELSKAAISKNINELEDYLKTPLINRTTRRMHITENGQLYYDRVRNILDEMENADQSIIESSQHLTGLIKVSVPMSVGLMKINPAICAFMQDYPDISVEVILSDQYVDLVDQGLDVAIRGGGALTNLSLKSRKLIGLNRLLCASQEYIDKASTLDSPHDLKQHNCLVYSLSSSPRQWTFLQQKETATVDIMQSSFVANNSIALKQAALAGVGVALVPELLVENEITSGQLVQLLPHWQVDKQALHAVYPFHKEQSQKVRLFIDFLVEYFND